MKIGLFLRAGSVLLSALAMVVSALGATPIQQTLKYWSPSGFTAFTFAIIEVTSAEISGQLQDFLTAYHGKGLPVFTAQVTEEGVTIRCYLPGATVPASKTYPLSAFTEEPGKIARDLRELVASIPAPVPEAPEKPEGGASGPEKEDAPPSVDTKWAHEFLDANISTVHQRLNETFPEKPGREEIAALMAKLTTLKATEQALGTNRVGVLRPVEEILLAYQTLAAQYDAEPPAADAGDQS